MYSVNVVLNVKKIEKFEHVIIITEEVTIRAFARANFILEFQWLYNKF